jgi:RecA-family ATPase
MMKEKPRDANDILRDEGPDALRERIDAARLPPEDDDKATGNGSEGQPLPFINMSTWDSVAPPARQWLVVDYIPLRQVTLMSGEGAIGKSILLLQLLASTALRREWIGDLFSKPGPVIYLGAEDEQDEIHRRLAAILDHYGACFSDLIAGGFKALAYAGKDAVLAEFDRNGRIKPTALYRSLHAEAVALQPSAIVVDTVSDVFLGDEIKRDQVRQFGSLMRQLAIDGNAAAIMASHPSLTGMKTGSGLSGSTHWHNTVRARAYFRKPASDEQDDGDDEHQPDDGRRELQFMKNQHGPLARCIQLQWQNGLWLPPAPKGKADKQADAERKVEDLFLTLLRRLTDQGRNVSDKTGTSYAPAQFAKQPEAKAGKITGKAFAAAMERLFAAKKIRVVTEGPPSRPRTKLVETASTDSSTEPSTTFHRPSTGVCVASPHTPLPVERARGRWKRPPVPPATGRKGRTRTKTNW